MKQRFKILWLPAWYPSKIDFLNGDFVERHAVAVSKFVDVIILSVVRDEALISSNTVIEVEENEGLKVYRGYYNSLRKNSILKKVILGFLYFKLLFKLYKIANKQNGDFNLVHVHVSLRQGLYALWLKITKRINYVITEHNSWFMPIGSTFFTKNFLQQKIIKANFKYASAIHVVSKSLGNELMKRYPFIKTFTVIPNVVDSNLFFYDSNNHKGLKTNFFAINGNHLFQKNTEGIIRAFSMLIKDGNECTLHIAGPNDSALKKIAAELNLTDSIIFYGQISNSAIATLMQKIDAFIFFTRYETFGCVMVEALCCGKPIIASSLDVLKENLVENVNGLFVASEDEDDLAEKLEYFTNNKEKFDNRKIAEDAIAKYNFDKVGKDFLAFYKVTLKE
jgi:glycosyltransferase involved in cell wall biosynthesis